MAWLTKPRYSVKKSENVKINEGLWRKCPECNSIVYNKDWEENLHVCNHCGYHDRLNAFDRIQTLIDAGTFVETFNDLVSVDTLHFHDGDSAYSDKLKRTMDKTKLKEAVVTGYGELSGKSVEIAVMDFSFFGGSMGSVVGEKITLSIESALKNKRPLIIVSSSGGARMHEGILSLMQMAKTSAALKKLSDADGLYLSVMTNPTSGGVTASFAMLGDLNIAERGAFIGFAGPRVIEQSMKQKLPPDFQTAEFLLEHGFVDMVAERKELKNILSFLINYLSK